MATAGSGALPPALSGSLLTVGLVTVAVVSLIVAPQNPSWVTSTGLGVGAGCAAAGVGGWFGRGRLAAHLFGLGVGQGAAYALFHHLQWHQRVQDPFYVAATNLRWPALLFAAYAAVIVGLALRWWSRARPRLPWHRLALAGGLVVCSSGLAMPHLVPFDVRNFMWAFVAGGGIAVVGAVHCALILRDGALVRRGPDIDDAAVALRWGWGVAGASAVASVVFSFWALDGAPSLEDDIAMLWQAQHLAAGHLYLVPPTVQESFQMWLVVDDGQKWFSYSPPGWPMVLALGVIVGAPWLVNPVLGIISVRLLQHLAARLHGPRVGLLSAVFLAASPWFVFMNGTQLAHPLTLCLGLLGLTAMESVVRTGGWTKVVGAGLAIGALTGVRTYDALVAGLPIAVWSLPRLPNWAVRAKVIAVGLPATLLPLSLTLLYNQHVCGHWARFPNNLGMARADWDISRNKLGFGADRDLGWRVLDPYPGHGLPDILVNTNHNLYYLNLETVGTLCGALGIVAILVVLGLRVRREDALWLGLAGSPVVCFAFYWFSGGAEYGPKYWYLALPGVTVLLALWIARNAHYEKGQDELRGGWHGVVLAAVLMSLLHYVPWRAAERFRDRKPTPANLPALEAAHDWSNALVFIRKGGSEPYGHAFLRNTPTLDGPGPVYARAVDAETDARLRALYPDREVWVLDPPARNGEDYVVVESPTK